jgi:serine/threonine-protein kinase
MNKWLWMGKYLIVIVVALILGSVLGDLEPFRSATVGHSHMNAGSLVQFIAQAGALGLLWLLGYRHSAQLRINGGRTRHLSTASFALVSLVVVSSFYGVLFHFLAPFLAPDVKSYLDWAFITAIFATAAWLLWALFVHSEAFLMAFGRGGAATSTRSRETA